jgi:5-methylcytosine-specific restriction endonuclease McrA
MAIEDIITKENRLQKRRDYYAKNKDAIREREKDSSIISKRKYYEKVKADKEWQEKQKKLREENKEKKKLYDKEYNLKNKDSKKEWAIKYYSKNKDSKIKYAKNWVKENKDKRSVISANYKAKRRSKTECGVSTQELLKWKESQPKICYWCNIKCDDEYHIDHYVPLSKGGKHEISNLVISCKRCNLTKQAKDPYEYASSVGRLF